MTMTVAPRVRARLKRANQRRLARLIEEGIGLVEHQHGRLAVQRARQRNPLCLARATNPRPSARAGSHKPRQLQDHLVHASLACGCNDGFIDPLDLVRRSRTRKTARYSP